jgi:hypothetical protein
MNDIPVYKNLQIEDLPGEEWKDILGYDGVYLISNLGRIKSYQREINMGIRGFRIQPERIMKQNISKSNYKKTKKDRKDLKIRFCIDNKKKSFHVSTLVGNTFIRELVESEVYCKKDKVWHNNSASNLEIMSISNSHKQSYKTGNFSRIKKHLFVNHENKFIYTRLSDGKKFISSELVKYYKKDVRSNIKKAIKNNRMAYKSNWIRTLIN